MKVTWHAHPPYLGHAVHLPSLSSR
jgi:hypothetical protein